MAEIGVFRGKMSAELLSRVNKLFLYMVDNWLDEALQPTHYRETGDYHAHLNAARQSHNKRKALEATAFAESRREVLHMESAEAAARVPDGSLDLVFLDGDHSYFGVRSDIDTWLPKLRPGGWLGGHDYGHTGKYEFGVERAVDEAVSQNGWVLELGAGVTWWVRP